MERDLWHSECTKGNIFNYLCFSIIHMSPPPPFIIMDKQKFTAFYLLSEANVLILPKSEYLVLCYNAAVTSNVTHPALSKLLQKRCLLIHLPSEILRIYEKSNNHTPFLPPFNINGVSYRPDWFQVLISLNIIYKWQNFKHVLTRKNVKFLF
jgi:hypothetical protein